MFAFFFAFLSVVKKLQILICHVRADIPRFLLINVNDVHKLLQQTRAESDRALYQQVKQSIERKTGDSMSL